jgi:hypothetical protein
MMTSSSQKAQQRARVQVVRLCVVAGVSLVVSGVLSSWYPTQAFYQMPSRAWQMLAGAIVFHMGNGHGLIEDRKPRKPIPPLVTALIELVSIVGPKVGIEEYYSIERICMGKCLRTERIFTEELKVFVRFSI